MAGFFFLLRLNNIGHMYIHIFLIHSSIDNTIWMTYEQRHFLRIAICKKKKKWHKPFLKESVYRMKTIIQISKIQQKLACKCQNFKKHTSLCLELARAEWRIRKNPGSKIDISSIGGRSYCTKVFNQKWMCFRSF